MGKSKIQTYLGFCIRAGHIIYGVDDIKKQKSGVYLLLVDEALGKSSLKGVIKAKEKLACKMYIVEKDYLGNLLYNPAVKVVGIKDKNLANAILTYIDSEAQFKSYSGGTN